MPLLLLRVFAKSERADSSWADRSAAAGPVTTLVLLNAIDRESGAVNRALR